MADEEEFGEDVRTYVTIDAGLTEKGIFHGPIMGMPAYDVEGDERYPFFRAVLELRQEFLAEERKENGESSSGSDQRRDGGETDSEADDEEWEIIESMHFRHPKTHRHWVSYIERSRKDGRFRKYRERERLPACERFQIYSKTCFTRANTALVEAEEKARERLRTLVNGDQWNRYCLTDAFAERGRSNILYVLRKNRPTVALRTRNDGGTILCVLCLHPLAYYVNTWAGALPPTDEIITHLLYIRADEYGLWKKANQIPPDSPLSGI